MSTPEASATPTNASYPPASIAWYSLGILLVAYTIAFVDRTILALLVGPIQRDLGISDTLMGLLHGIAFALFYCALGIPIARLSDQHSRRWIILIGMMIWSAMTALCGVARNFWHLFIARIGVGVGEAALSPAAYSMIADMFPPHRLARALGVYSCGGFFGAGIAFMIGGAVIGALEATREITLRIVGVIRSWHAVVSRPIAATWPVALQKLFCMSMTIRAALSESMCIALLLLMQGVDELSRTPGVAKRRRY